MRPFSFLCVLSLLAASGTAQAWTLERGSVGVPTTLDPHLSRTVQDAMIAVDLHAGLTGWNGDGTASPMLASDWAVSQDGLTWTFTLDPSAQWSDGSPLTASDVVASFHRALDPATASVTADFLSPIVGADAVIAGEGDAQTLGIAALDPATVEIVLTDPTPWLPSLLAQPVARIFDPTGERSSGPFLLAERLVGDALALVRNPHFHGWAAADGGPTRVVWTPIEDQAAALRRFAAGEIDHHLTAPLDEALALLGADNPAIHRGPRAAIYSYTLNPASPPLDDLRVRQALVLALDRDRLADLADAIASDRFIPPETAGIGDTVPWERSVDPLAREDEAIALARDAGLDPSEPVTLTLKTMAGDVHRQVAAAVADMWAPLGIDLAIETRDNAAHWGGLIQGEPFEIARTGWIAEFDDATSFIAAVASNSPYNFARWQDDAFDRLLAEARTTAGADRADRLSAAEEILLADAVTVPLFIPGKVELLNPQITGWEPNPRLWLPSWRARHQAD